MPKETEDFPEFDDWTPPWGDEDPDPEKAARLVYNARKSEHKLKLKNKAQNEELEEARQAITVYQEAQEAAKKDGETETEALQRQIEALNKKLAEKPKDDGPNLEVVRLRLALEHGLTERQAKRLVGSNEDELAEDAEALVEELGLDKSGSDEEVDGKAGSDENPDAVQLRRRPRGHTAGDPEPQKGPEVDYTNPENLDKVIPRGW